MFLGVPEFMPKNAHADALTSAAAQRSLELDFGIIPYCVKLYIEVLRLQIDFLQGHE